MTLDTVRDGLLSNLEGLEKPSQINEKKAYTKALHVSELGGYEKTGIDTSAFAGSLKFTIPRVSKQDVNVAQRRVFDQPLSQLTRGYRVASQEEKQETMYAMNWDPISEAMGLSTKRTGMIQAGAPGQFNDKKMSDADPERP